MDVADEAILFRNVSLAADREAVSAQALAKSCRRAGCMREYTMIIAGAVSCVRTTMKSGI
jgi:hypothetical protein